MKIALGTVQFGMEYGVATPGGQVCSDAVQEILKAARLAGIDTLDTAAVYGNSEQVLGNIGVDGFKIISKIPTHIKDERSFSDWVNRNVEESLAHLKTNSLYGLLLHRPLDLLRPNGFELYEALLSLKKQGLVENIGVSVYGPDDLELLAEFAFDIVQAPMNILDRRLADSGWLGRLSRCGTKIHIRSAFLQGLLLMPKEQLPKYFQPWKVLMSDYDNWVKGLSLSPLQVCLGYLSQFAEIDKIVVGVQTAKQLHEIVAAVDFPLPSIPENIQTSDLNLINPSLWKL